MLRRFLGRVLPFVLLLTLISGCGSGAASISGQVTYNSEPVGDGWITFLPADGKGPPVAGQIEGGQYQVDNIPPGPKLVKVEAVKKVPFARTSEEMAKRAAVNKVFGDGSGLIDPADVIPPNAVGNNTTFKIEPGQQTHDFHLKKPGGAKGK